MITTDSTTTVVIQGSDDDTNWDRIHEVYSNTYTDSSTYDRQWNNNNYSYRYYRVINDSVSTVHTFEEMSTEINNPQQTPMGRQGEQQLH